MLTIAELVRGFADGRRFKPFDPAFPDEWPDAIEITDRGMGVSDVYCLRAREPQVQGGVRVYFYDHHHRRAEETTSAKSL